MNAKEVIVKVNDNVYEIVKEVCSYMNSFLTLSGISTLFLLQESTENWEKGVSEIYSKEVIILTVFLWVGLKLFLYITSLLIYDLEGSLRKIRNVLLSLMLVFFEIEIIQPSKAIDFFTMYITVIIGTILCLMIRKLTNVLLKEKDETESSSWRR